MRVLLALAGFLLVAGIGIQLIADDKKPDPIMKQKLVHAQKIMEGIALGNFETIERNADELIIISHKAGWRVLQTPDYTRFSDEFRRNCENVAKGAKQKNIDAASLAYVQMTLTCVACHKHVREVRMACMPEGGGDSALGPATIRIPVSDN